MKYPKGQLNQHKALATGASLAKCDKRDLDCCDGWGQGSKATEGRTNIQSGTSTGSGGGGSSPKSTFTPA